MKTIQQIELQTEAFKGYTWFIWAPAFILRAFTKPEVAGNNFTGSLSATMVKALLTGLCDTRRIIP